MNVFVSTLMSLYFLHVKRKEPINQGDILPSIADYNIFYCGESSGKVFSDAGLPTIKKGEFRENGGWN